MYKKCLKTYGYLLRYVFFILGILFLAILLGGSIAFSNSKAAVGKLADNVSKITKNADLSFDDIRDAIISTFNDKPAKKQVEDIRGDGLAGATENVLAAAVNKTIGNYEQYAEQISDEIGNTVGSIISNFMILIVFQIIALIIAENFVAILAGRDRLKKTSNGIAGNLINKICRLIYQALSVLLILLALNIVPILGIIILLAYPLLSCFLAMVSRYYISVKDKCEFSKVVNLKNVFTLFIIDVICIALSILISLIVLAIVGGFAAFYIFVSLLVVTNVTIRLNAYQFAEQYYEDEHKIVEASEA